jgi:hypothetical protein
MGLFEVIIFAEKVWYRGIWIARVEEIMFVIIIMLSITGIILISTEEVGMNNSPIEMKNMMMRYSNQDRDNN